MKNIKNIINEEISNIVESSNYETIIHRTISEVDNYKEIIDNFQTIDVFGSKSKGHREYYFVDNKIVTDNRRYVASDMIREIPDPKTLYYTFKIDGKYRFVRNPNYDINTEKKFGRW